MSRRRMMQSQGGELPSGYTRCLYLEGNGTQYIKLNQGSSSDMILKLTAQYTSLIGKQAIVGLYTNNTYQLIGNNGSAFLFIEYGDPYFSTPVNLNKFDVEVNFTNNRYIVCGIEYDLSWAGYRDYRGDFYLFWANNVTDGRKKAWIKLFDMIIYRDLELSLNLIPSLDPTGRPCMYDTVTKQPFYNQGTGEFLYELA